MADGATVAAPELERWTRALLEAAGLEPGAAATVAETLIDTSLRGVDSHGVARLPVYVERLRTGVLNARPRPSVASRDGAIAVVDGDQGPGQVAAVFATDLSSRSRASTASAWWRCGAAPTSARRRSTRGAPPTRGSSRWR